jgi:hypothetical protein
MGVLIAVVPVNPETAAESMLESRSVVNPVSRHLSNFPDFKLRVGRTGCGRDKRGPRLSSKRGFRQCFRLTVQRTSSAIRTILDAPPGRRAILRA